MLQGEIHVLMVDVNTLIDFRYLATTFFAPIDARKAFPCFDEPALKALFDVTLVRKTSKIALSNTPNISSERR
jgi:aminopeptidase N